MRKLVLFNFVLIACLVAEKAVAGSCLAASQKFDREIRQAPSSTDPSSVYGALRSNAQLMRRTLEVARICQSDPSLSPQEREIHRRNAEMLHRHLLQSEEGARIVREK